MFIFFKLSGCRCLFFLFLFHLFIYCGGGEVGSRRRYLLPILIWGLYDVWDRADGWDWDLEGFYGLGGIV